MQKLLDKIMVYFFSKTPIVKAIDGKKRWIGNLLLFLSGTIELANQFFDWSVLSEANVIILALIGGLTRLIGDFSKDAKERIKIGN